MNTFADLKKMKDEYYSKVQNEGKAMLTAYFAEFFKNNPEVKALQWRQYAPAFNDGDACVFSVHDVDWSPDGEDFMTSYSEACPKDTRFAVDCLTTTLHAHEDVLEAVFGSGYEITANSDGTFHKTEYYD